MNNRTLECLILRKPTEKDIKVGTTLVNIGSCINLFSTTISMYNDRTEPKSNAQVMLKEHKELVSTNISFLNTKTNSFVTWFHGSNSVPKHQIASVDMSNKTIKYSDGNWDFLRKPLVEDTSHKPRIMVQYFVVDASFKLEQVTSSHDLTSDAPFIDLGIKEDKSFNISYMDLKQFEDNLFVKREGEEWLVDNSFETRHTDDIDFRNNLIFKVLTSEGQPYIMDSEVEKVEAQKVMETEDTKFTDIESVNKFLHENNLECVDRDEFNDVLEELFTLQKKLMHMEFINVQNDQTINQLESRLHEYLNIIQSLRDNGMWEIHKERREKIVRKLV